MPEKTRPMRPRRYLSLTPGPPTPSIQLGSMLRTLALLHAAARDRVLVTLAGARLSSVYNDWSKVAASGSLVITVVVVVVVRALTMIKCRRGWIQTKRVSTFGLGFRLQLLLMLASARAVPRLQP